MYPEKKVGENYFFSPTLSLFLLYPFIHWYRRTVSILLIGIYWIRYLR